MRLFRHHISSRALILFAFESALTMAVINFGLTQFLAQYSGRFLYGPSRAVTIVMMAAAMAGILVSLGIYEKWNLADWRRMAERLAVAMPLCFPLFWIILYLQLERAPVTAPAVVAACAAMTAIPLFAIMLSRLIYARVVGVADLRHRVIVLGAGPRAVRIEKFNAERDGQAFEVVGYVALEGEERSVACGRILPDATIESLPLLVRDMRIDEIVVAVADRRGVALAPLLECRFSGVAITDHATFWEREARQIASETLDPGWLIYAEGFTVASTASAMVKRSFDLIAAALFAVFLLPLIVLVAIAIRLDSAGPALYTQERVGRDGRVFVLFKFRSMQADSEADGQPRWAAAADPRVTRVGAFLRKARIDELPQLLNVLRGDMSFVGPRPERPFFVENLSRSIPFYRERFRVRPGITGWAQINYPYGASVEDAREKLAYDLYYIKNYSIILDFLVLLETAQIVLWPKGVR